MMSNNYISQYLLFTHSIRSESELFQTGYFTADVYSALQVSLAFLTDVLKATK